MTYEVGQKILVEATVIDPEVDQDGDIQVEFGGYDSYVPAANTRPIEPEPQTIAFEDIRVGDVLRVVSGETKRGTATSRTVCDNVTVVSREGSRIKAEKLEFTPYMGGYTYELISRPEPEPEPIKVGDTVTVEQVKMLPVGSVVDCGRPRTVALTGLFDAHGGTTYGWGTYGGPGAGLGFTVKYIAGVDNTV